MADFTNRQLADIISVVAEKISKDLIKNEKVSKAISENLTKTETVAAGLDGKIDGLKNTVLKPDLSEINSFYETKTAENIKKINNKLSIPNVVLYTWLGVVFLFLLSACMLYLAYATAIKTKTEYKKEFFKENIIISKEDEKLFDDMHQFFYKNPKTKEIFIKSRESK
jgi:hypothetical protein